MKASFLHISDLDGWRSFFYNVCLFGPFFWIGSDTCCQHLLSSVSSSHPGQQEKKLFTIQFILGYRLLSFRPTGYKHRLVVA